VRDKLFRDEDPVGKYIVIDRIPTRVMGVLSERGITGSGHNLDDRIIMPITTVMKKLLNEDKYISAIRVRFTDVRNMEDHVDKISELLRIRHNIRENEDDDFFVVTPKEIVKFLVALTGSLVAFLGIIGGISLVVSGFVIANLFLISVSERLQEIGIRRAVGAKRREILLQFLFEVFVITTAGALFGFLLGYVSSHFLKQVAEFSIHFSYKAFLGAMFVAWLVALISGLQPARAASRVNPIESMRG
jgi:putative ABC transport system permease protein